MQQCEDVVVDLTSDKPPSGATTPQPPAANGAGPSAQPNGCLPHSGAGLPTGQLALCPYCGHRQSNRVRCERCRGLFEPLSRQATQNAMGSWFVRDESNPFCPGCSYDTLKQLTSKGRIRPETIIRGPSTRQFWTLACNTPGVAVLLGECHACHVRVEPDDYLCKRCGAVLSWSGDRQHLGLTPIKLLPGQAPARAVASSGMMGLLSRTATTPAQPEADADDTIDAIPSSQSSNDIQAPIRTHLTWKAIALAVLGVAVIAGAATAVMILAPA